MTVRSSVSPFRLFALFALVAISPFPLFALSPHELNKASTAFTQNVGQVRYTDGEAAAIVDAVAQFGNTTAFVHRTGMYVVQSRVHRVKDQRAPEVDYFRTDMDLVGSNPMSRLETVDAGGTIRLYGPGDSALGRTAERWKAMIYRDVYPGIDLRITSNASGPKIDFIVHPGADPSQIALRYQGADQVLVREDGSLWTSTPLGSLRESAPVSWNELPNGSKSIIASSFTINGNTIRFNIGAYDHNKTLVIDPQREWATYYGGNGGFSPPLTTVDADGYIYLSGSTVATNLPRSTGVFQSRIKAKTDGFIVKWNDAGQFIWQTFVGGTGSDEILDITTDAKLNIWVCGSLDSNNHPLVGLDLNGSGPYGTLEGDTIIGEAGFVMRLTPDGLWGDSWIVDGREQDGVSGIAFNNDRLAITGYTRSPRVNEITGNPYPHNPANNTRQYDMFVSRLVLRPGGQYRWQNDWLSYYGGSLDDRGKRVVIDAAGNVTAMGYTYADDVPTTDGTVFRGVSDVMIVRFTTPTPYTPQRAWATLVGGTDYDDASDLKLDATGNLLIAGYTSSANFPVNNAFQGTLAGNSDGFLRKMAAANGAAIFSTFFGGNEADALTSLSLDKAGRIWVGGGTTASTNLPVTNDAFQKVVFDDPEYYLTDGFFAQFAADGRSIIYCSYYGAPAQDPLPPLPSPPDPPPPPSTDYGSDQITDVYADGNAYVILASTVNSIRMPTTPGAYQDSTTLKKDTIQANDHLSLFNNCKDSVINVVINGSPNLCVVETRQLIAPAGFAKYKWSTGDTLRQITISDTGRYVVTCTTVDGCRYRDTVRITRNPSPNVTAGNDTTACLNVAVKLTATSTGGTQPYKYKWKRQEAGPTYIDDDTLRQPSVNPATTSNYIVTVTDVNGCTDIDTVKVTITDPRPTASPTLVDFGTLDACQSSKTATMRVRNPMPYPIAITGATPDGSGIAVQTDLTGGVVVNAGDSALITLIATPTNVGVTNGTITLTGDPCAWKLTVNYKITKSSLAATITPSVLDFGAGVSCTSVSRDSFAVIRNSGTEALNLQPGLIDAPFSIVSPTVATTINPGDTLRVVIRYNPVADGTFSTNVRFPFTTGACNDTLRVTARGTRTSVNVSATPTTIDYGTLEGCEDERDTVITIANSSAVDVTVTMPSRADVVFTPAGPLTIKANSTAQVTVTIRPAAAGAFATTADLTVQPCDQKITLNLSAVKQGVAFTTPASIDMGEVNSCLDPATRTRSYTVSFDGTGTSTATSVVTGPSITTSLANGTTFTGGTPQNFDVVWTPTVDGALVDSIVITFEPCSIRRVIRVNGVRTTPSLRSVNPNIVLGALTGDATGTITFENNGTDTLFVGTLTSQNANVVTATPLPTEPLLPGALLIVEYRIDCVPIIDDTITARTTSGCPLSARTIFEGLCDNAVDVSATVVIDDATVKTGDRFNLPMRLTQSTGLNAAGLRNWRARITYNPMVVVGTGATPDCYIEGQYTPCTIEITGTRTDTVGLLANLDLTAVLGTDSRTDVVLSSFQWTEDTTYVTTTKNGSVTLSDICEEGGIRLLDPKSSAFNIRVYPIPASTTLTIDVRGMGSQAGTWTLFSYIGSQVANGTLTPDAQGNAKDVVDVSTLSSGTYFLTIDARGQISRMPVLIQR